MWLFDLLFENKETDKSDKNKHSNDYLSDEEKKLVDDGLYDTSNFEEEDLEEDDYYYEDEEDGEL